MPIATFHGEIQGGRIVTGQPLTDFEGKQVIITLTVADSAGRPEATADSQERATPPFSADEAEILEDLGRIQIAPRDAIAFKARIIDVGRLPPRVYLSDKDD